MKKAKNNFHVKVTNKDTGKTFVLGFQMEWAALAYINEVNRLPGMKAELTNETE